MKFKVFSKISKDKFFLHCKSEKELKEKMEKLIEVKMLHPKYQGVVKINKNEFIDSPLGADERKKLTPDGIPI